MKLFEKKKLCTHRWVLSDYIERESYNGVSSDIEEYYVLSCRLCGESRHVSEHLYVKMRRLCLITEDVANDD